MSSEHSKDSVVQPSKTDNEIVQNTETVGGESLSVASIGATCRGLDILVQTMLDTVHQPLLVLDDQLRVCGAGRAFWRTFRVTPEETVGQFIYDLGNGQWNIPRLRQLLEEIGEQNTCFDGFEVEHEFEELGHRTMCLNARCLEYVEGGPQRILLAIEDITESNRLERESQSGRLAEAVVRTGRDPLLILEASQHVHLANEAFYRTFKVSPAEIEGELIYALGNGHWNIPELRQRLENIVLTNTAFDDFDVTRDFDRIGHRTMLLSGRKLTGDGPPERILLSVQDITVRKQAEAAQSRLAAIVESSDDAIISKDLNGVITSWNRGAERLFGYTSQQVVGQSVTILIPPGRFDEEAVILERIRRGERIERYETVRRRNDGKFLDVSLTISPITDSQGQVVGASKIIHDITERKQAENALALLASVSQDLVRLTATDEIMQNAGARLGAHLDLSVCNFIEINETADQAVCTHEWTRGNVPGTVGVHRLADYVTDDFRKSVRAEEVVVVRDTATDPRTNKERFNKLNIRSFISVPLARDGQWKALFNVHRVTPHDWRADEIGLVRDLATRIWTRLERARVEEAVRRAAEFDEAVMSNMGEGLYTVDDEGLVTFMNAAAEKFLGWKLEELLGKKMHELIHYKHPDGRPFPASECAGLQVLRQGATLTEHADVFISKDGTFLDVVYSSSPLRDNGRIRGLVVVFRDVAERKKAEEALRKSEQRFAQFMQHLPGLAWIKDAEGRYVYVNDRAEIAFAAQRAELYSRTDRELFPPETATQFMQNDQQALASDSGIQAIETLKHADGTIHYSIVSKFPIPDPEGQAIMVGGVAFDVTEQKRVEEALRESEARFRLLADSAPVLIWVNGLDGCEFVNREFLQFLGRTMEEVQGMNWATALHPDDAEAYLDVYRQSFEERTPFEAQFRFRREDGEFRWMKSAGLPRFAAEGSFLGYVGCSFDITDVKQYQEALFEADRRKNEFLAMLAHELRNPLAPIRNALEILRLTEGNPVVVQSASEMIERQIGQMIRLVDDLLDVSRITRGRIDLRTGIIDLVSLVNDAVEVARPRLDSKGLNLVVTLPSEPIYLEADPIRLAQVVGNLLNNAGKFTDRGGRIWVTTEVVMSSKMSDEGRVTRRECREGSADLPSTEGLGNRGSEEQKLVTCHSALATSPHAVIRVRDTGIGIAVDQLPHIFDMFFQVDTSLERRQSGLGIGLMLAKNIAELHGGTLEGQSGGLGQGSEFVVRLPLSNAELRLGSGQTKESDDDAVAAQTVPAVTRRRILVVDDNLDSTESLTTLLDLNGNETRAAYDGLEALKVAAGFRPDVILLDIGLPELNGYEVARKIREQPWGEKIVLVALTGWGQEEDRRRSREAGFNHHLTKPVDPTILKKLLAEPKS